MVIIFSLIHTGATAGALLLTECSRNTLIWSFALWPITALGITGGAHRLWSHRSYTATTPIRFLLMICNSMANQGCILHWARDHRVHHKFSEMEADPHDATRGFFFAHMGWLLVKKEKAVITEGRKIDLSDLYGDWVVMLQQRLHPWGNLFSCFVFPALVAHYGWGESLWTGFLVSGVLRYTLFLHATMMVNSVAHIYGDHPYDEKSYPAENLLVSVATIGEGWHNWHHKFPFDYAASEFGILSQYNPTKLFVDFCCMVGLCSDRKRATKIWAKLKVTREEEKRAAVAERAEDEAASGKTPKRVTRSDTRKAAASAKKVACKRPKA